MPKPPRADPSDNNGNRIKVPGRDPKYPWTEVVNRLIKFNCLLCRSPVFTGESYWRRGQRAGQPVKGLPTALNFRWVRVCVSCYEGKCQ